MEIVKRSDSQKSFVVQIKRWIVERTNAWNSRDRALAKDYERTGESAEVLLQVSMIRVSAGLEGEGWSGEAEECRGRGPPEQ